MNRRLFIKTSAILPGLVSGIGSDDIYTITNTDNPIMTLAKTQFGNDFHWGVSTAAFQTEGAFQDDGKGLSIWDTFTNTPGNIADGSNARFAVDFYHRYQQDLDLINQMHFNNFRFSLSWPRILPEGIGRINTSGVDYYQRLIDSCLNRQIEPWITLYHWDLPQALEDKGGWTNREIVDWFSEYVNICTQKFGSQVKKWIVLNEPMSFVGLGYFLGSHAPGRKGVRNFLRAAHHAALCQAEGGRVVRANIPDAYIGTTFSCSHIKPVDKKEKNINAALRMDALLNRLFIEPSLGMGYPKDTLVFLKGIEKHYLPGDEERLKFDFDFIGLQYYFRTITRFSLFPPLLFANEVPAHERQANTNTMGFEIFPKGLYKMIKKFSQYPGVKDIIITESGVCLDDRLENLKVADPERIAYYKDSLSYILKARGKGIPVKGFFAWTLMDNFEWAEGYKPRFGLVYTNHENRERIMKDSGMWFGEFLSH